MSPDVTIISLVRHGHGTAPAHIEALYAHTDVPFHLVYADINSPAPVADYLAGQARGRRNFTHLRFDAFVSRQCARLAALERVDTPCVALVDNNMVCEPGWLPALLEAQEATGAALVSPVIVTRGGAIHYSGGRIVARRSLQSLGRRAVHRPQDVGASARTPLQDVSLRRMDVDFVESHCCLAATAELRRPGVLEPAMHNAHTLCYAACRLKRLNRRVVFEPAAVSSIVPVGFGYDLPWMCLEYLRRDRLQLAYARLRELLGRGPATDTGFAFRWHAKHFKYLLLSMLEGDRLRTGRLLYPGDVPERLTGYDAPLPADAVKRIERGVLPFIRERYPDLLGCVRAWLAEPHC